LEDAWNGARLDVTLSQEHGKDGSVTEHFFDATSVLGSHATQGGARPLPPEDQAAMKAALESGMVLTLSLWQSEDLSWLDGGCADWIGMGLGMCSLDSAAVTISNVHIAPIPPPPAPPPMPPPAVPKPPPPSPSPQPSPPPFQLLLAASTPSTREPFVSGVAVGVVITLFAVMIRAWLCSPARELCDRLLCLRHQAVPAAVPAAGMLRADETADGDLAEEDGLLEVRKTRKKTLVPAPRSAKRETGSTAVMPKPTPKRIR